MADAERNPLLAGWVPLEEGAFGVAPNALAGPSLAPRQAFTQRPYDMYGEEVRPPSTPQLSQSNAIHRLLSVYGQHAADTTQRGLEGNATPQEVAHSYFEGLGNPVGPFGIGAPSVEFTEPMRAALRQMYQANMPMEHIAERLGVAADTLRNRWPQLQADLGLETRARYSNRAPAELLQQYREQGLTNRAIAERTGLSPSTIKSNFSRYGITNPPVRRPADTVEQVADLRRQGQSYGDISRGLGITRSQVAGIIRDLRAQGVPIPAALFGALLSQYGDNDQSGSIAPAAGGVAANALLNGSPVD